MSPSNPQERRVLALHQTSRGFAFVVLEFPSELVDWGARSTPARAASAAVGKVSTLLEQYSPDVLLTADCVANAPRRNLRRMRFLGAVVGAAASKGAAVRRISKQKVRKVFDAFEAVTRREIALVVARMLPELAPRVPRIRKPWMPEDYSAAIFDAAALALAHFSLRRSRDGRAPAPLSAQMERDAFAKADAGSGH
jgi:Holliday junction resolvasome RuvABC endonuclease subunit